MYINHLIVGAYQLSYQLYVTPLHVDQRAFPFRFVFSALSPASLFSPSSSASSFFLFFPRDASLLYSGERKRRSRAEKIPADERSSTGAALCFSSPFILFFRILTHTVCYIRRRTTSIDWHIKRKQHLDQSR